VPIAKRNSDQKQAPDQNGTQCTLNKRFMASSLLVYTKNDFSLNRAQRNHYSGDGMGLQMHVHLQQNLLDRHPSQGIVCRSCGQEVLLFCKYCGRCLNCCKRLEHVDVAEIPTIHVYNRQRLSAS
jgi:hypothetical protein